MSRKHWKGIWCPYHCDYMFIVTAEQISGDKIKVRYRCEYCGCIKEITYKIQPIHQEWWD